MTVGGAAREGTVIAMGNLLMGDDGVGIRAAEALRSARPGTRIVDGGLLGLELLAAVEDSARVLVLDCVDAGLTPGSLIEVSARSLPQLADAILSPHQLDLMDLVLLAALRGREPDVVTVLGVQPRCVEPSVELSPEVDAVVPRLVRRAEAILDGWSRGAAAG